MCRSRGTFCVPRQVQGQFFALGQSTQSYRYTPPITGPAVSDDQHPPNSPPASSPARRRLEAAAEISLIFAVFFIHAGWPVPEVNETHYLAKAKHYWNPDWCARDFFLTSADAHQVFYWTCGWITRWLSLPAAAWVGRIVTWALLAWAWRRLSVAIVPTFLYSVLSAALFVAATSRLHMAGEWIIGGFEAKGLAYVFVLLGLEAVARNRWSWVWPLLGACRRVSCDRWRLVGRGGWPSVAWCRQRAAAIANHAGPADARTGSRAARPGARGRTESNT